LGDEVLDLALGPDGWTADGARIGTVLRQGDRVHVFSGGTQSFRIPDPLAVAVAVPGTGLSLSPMPGLVRRVHVAAGDSVVRGAPLAVLEAMKMEHVLTAARDGRVAEVLVSEGAQVEAGAPLIRLEEE
jgi:3-methylcrotonyl-CoA carboxylase alpha subunit